jgi:hypothetical protein
VIKGEFVKLRSFRVRRKSVNLSRATRAAVEPLESRVLLSSYTVTNLNDSGSGSLRDAVQQANVNPGADTINVMPGLAGAFTLTSAKLEISDTTGQTAIIGLGEASNSLNVYSGIYVDAGVSAAILASA